MNCKSCNKGTCILVTRQNKVKHREHQGLLLWIVTAPWRLLKFIFRFGVAGSKTEYHKQTHWKCNYCGHTFEDTPPPSAEIPGIPSQPVQVPVQEPTQPQE